MKKSAVIGSWMPKLAKACFSKGSEVKIVLLFANGLPCLAHWILQVTHVYICNNKLTPIGLSGDQDPAGNVQSHQEIIFVECYGKH